ncbi:MAG: 30S ribosomal protein S21 [Candidatus Cloacimonas sp.]|nr:30S ribosomal protein S21 [Candidatus Cloacimonadota bacterium]
MPVVYSRDGEPFEIMLKRFKKKCEKAAILSDIKKHQAYEKPSEEKKRKANVARRKAMKMARKARYYS